MVGADLGLSLYPIVLDICRLVKDTAVSFCKARKLVNKKCEEVVGRKYEAERWLREADDMIATSPPSSIPRIQDYRRKLDEALSAYESDINGWHKAINLEPPDGTVHGCAGRTRQRLALKGRAKYAVVGRRRLKKLESKIKEQEEHLRDECSAAVPRLIVHTASSRKVELSPKSLQLVPASALRFIKEARLREEQRCPIDETIWDLNNFPYEFVNTRLVDGQTRFMYIEEYKLMLGTLRPRATSQLARVPFSEYRNCIIVHRTAAEAPEIGLEETHMLARLFKDDPSDSQSDGFKTEPDDGHMLRCCKIIRYGESRCEMLFKTPPGCNPMPRSLRQMLLHDTSRTGPPHPLIDRVKLSIRLAAALHVVHSLGLVHKRVHPETILVFEPLEMNKKRTFPQRLGYPYLTAFNYMRSDIGGTFGYAECQALRRRSIYTHPRDQGEEREDRFRQRDDIYSLGIVLFEVGTFTSLFTDYDDTIRDYVHNDSFVPLSDANFPNFMDPKDRAEAKIPVLLAATTEKLAPIMGNDFAEVVHACICAGYPDSPFHDDPSLKEDDEKQHTETADGSGRKSDSVKYLELVLKKLHAIHDRIKLEMKDKHEADENESKTEVSGEAEEKCN